MDEVDRRARIRGTREHGSGGQENIYKGDRRDYCRLGGEQSMDEGERRVWISGTEERGSGGQENVHISGGQQSMD